MNAWRSAGSFDHRRCRADLLNPVGPYQPLDGGRDISLALLAQKFVDNCRLVCPAVGENPSGETADESHHQRK